jgi:alkenylglycerophosphocholine/alkenylglycerophosphoethanolamine hydrolase
MSTFGIKEQFRGPVVIAATGLFLCFSILFFMPAEIPHKITLPVATLALASLWLCPWQISAALIFSAAGDYMGSCGNFLWQMTFFAIGHILYIIYFIGRYLRNDMKMTGRRKGYLITIVICAAALLTFALCRIIPQAYLKEGAMIGTGTGIYATLICLMLVSALMQRSCLFALGAVLFVFSDFTLAWNKFINPVPCRDYLVLVTYFLAQWLIFARSTGYRMHLASRHARL